MAIPTFVNAGLAISSTVGVILDLPLSIQDDDILLLHIEGEGEDANADAAPTGWTLIGSVASGTSGAQDKTRQTLYWHRYDSAAMPDEICPDAGNHILTVVTAWRGCTTTESPIHKQQSSSSGTNDTSVSMTGVTTDVDDCAIVASSTSGDTNIYSGWTNASLSSPAIASIVDVLTGSGSDGSLHVAWGGLPSAGASGTTTATSTVSEEEANWVIALKPVAVVGGGTGKSNPLLGPLRGPLAGPIG